MRCVELVLVFDDILTPLQASLYEVNSRYTFFGTHYPRLKTIKNKWDPKGLFIVAKGVGSEEWDETLNCRI